MPEKYDVVIVGCGPAGASCAGRASELGLSVVAIDRATFPRSKPCAAGLTQTALALLGADADRVAHYAANRLRIESERVSVLLTARAPIIRTTTRRELDALLVERAEESGACIEYGAAATGVLVGENSVTVTTREGSYEGRYLVGADGPRSVVARSRGYLKQRLCGAAYVRAFPPSPSELGRFKGTVYLHPTATVRGYGWIFPKRDHLNVGVYSQRALHSALLQDLARYLRWLGIETWASRGPFAAPIPTVARLGDLGRGRVLLVGDAAGLADPTTGEGIPHAMASGRLAAESVAEALRDGSKERDDAGELYARRVRREIVPRLARTRRLGNLLYSLGPRGIGRAMEFPPARFVLRRMGWWERSSEPRGNLVVEATDGRGRQQ